MIVKAIVCAAIVCGFSFSAPCVGKSQTRGGKPLKVLMIGNSFSVCNLAEMPRIAEAMGLALDLASLCIGGTDLEDHWNNVLFATNRNFKPYRYDRFVRNQRKMTNKSANILSILAAEKWDIVTIQQSSHLSMNLSTFHPSGDHLVAKIREIAPQARIFVQETWSYPDWDRRYGMFGFDHAAMHARVKKAYAAFAAEHKLGVIPVGTAAEICPNRNALFTKPDYHFNREGVYLQGLTWVAKIFECDVNKCKYHPKWMKAERAAELKKAAMKSCTSPGSGVT